MNAKKVTAKIWLWIVLVILGMAGAAAVRRKSK